MIFKIGDRVTHKYLGAATVIGEYVDNSLRRWAYTIMVDVKPSVRYNMGNKRCFVFPADLETLSEEIK